MKLSEQAYLDIVDHACMSALRAYRNADQLFDEPGQRARLAVSMALAFFGIATRMVQHADDSSPTDDEAASALALTLIKAIQENPPPRLQKVAT